MRLHREAQVTWHTESRRALGAKRIARATLVATAATAAVASIGAAQAPTAPPDTSKGYRPPTIVLVQPIAQNGIPADRPVVVFRFAQGEAEDPIDATSLRVWVDGDDRSSSFQLANGAAWGSLSSRLTSGDSATGGATSAMISPGVHLVIARVCSTRGVCGEARAPVTVLPAVDAPAAAAASDSVKAAASPQSATIKRSLAKKILDALLGGARKLLAP